MSIIQKGPLSVGFCLAPGCQSERGGGSIKLDCHRCELKIARGIIHSFVSIHSHLPTKMAVVRTLLHYFVIRDLVVLVSWILFL